MLRFSTLFGLGVRCQFGLLAIGLSVGMGGLFEGMVEGYPRCRRAF